MLSMLEPIRIGLMTPFTGLVKLYGLEISWAGQIAVDEINESGGLLGRKLELITVDDGSLPDTAVPAARNLINNDGCVAIIGNLLSNSRISVANMVADPSKVPYLNFSFYEGSIWSRYYFNFSALPNQQIDKMIPYMAERFGSKIFFAGSNYEWPRGSIDAGKRSLLSVGGEVVGETYIPLGTDNFDGLLDKLQTSGADVFVPYFAGSDQTNLLTQFSNRGLKGRMAVVMGHYDEAMIQSLPPEVREGFFSSNTYFMSVDTPESKSYLDRLARNPEVSGLWPKGNGVLTNFGEGTYVCVKAFAAAAEKAGSVNAELIVEALETMKVRGPQGLVEMDPTTHHAKVNTHLAQCRADGTFELIKSFGSLDPVIPDRYRKIFPMLREDNFTDEENNYRKNKKDIVESRDDLKTAIIKVNVNALITEVNDPALQMFGYSENEMVGISINIILPPHLRDQHQILFEKFMNSDRTLIAMGQQGEVFGYRKDGSQFAAKIRVIKTQRGGHIEAIATVIDITKQTELVDMVNMQATHDQLTGLINRSLLTERLSSALNRASRNGTKVQVVLFDIDGFGALNNDHGFDVGDKVLVEVSNALLGESGSGDTIGRLGGDEFLLIRDKIEQANSIDDMIARINKKTEEIPDVGPIRLNAKVFTGIAANAEAAGIIDDLEGVMEKTY